MRAFLMALAALLSRRVGVPAGVVRWCRVAAVLPVYFALGLATGALQLLVEEGFGPQVNWFSCVLRWGLGIAVFVGLGVLLAAVLDSLYQGWCGGPGERLDFAYWPRFWRLPALLHSPACRIIFMCGAGCIVAYLAWVSHNLRYGPRHGTLWPGRTTVVVLFAWGVLWFADAIKRPSLTTLCPSLVHLGFVALLGLATAA